MRLSALILVGFAVIGLMLTGLSFTVASQALRELRDIRHAAVLGRVETTAMGATVAMSLERSVTQVALAYAEPIPSGFREIIDEQRSLADEGLAAALAIVAENSFIETGEDYVRQTTDSLARVAALRLEIDSLLAKPSTESDPKRTYEAPFELKEEVVTLKNATTLLRNRTGVSTRVAGALSAVQLGSWEVREFGGRARTHFAIATMNSAPIGPSELAQVRLDSSRASEAWQNLNNSVRSVPGLPNKILEQIDVSDEQYFQTYIGLVEELEVISETHQGQGVVDYGIDFGDFFAQSNAALEAMEYLSENSGNLVIEYWQSREDRALTIAVASCAFAIVSLIVLGTIYLQIRKRVVGLLGAATRILKALAQGDLDVRVRENRRELKEIKELFETVETFRKALLEARRVEAKAKEEAERLQKEEAQRAKVEREEIAQRAMVAERERKEAEERMLAEKQAAQEIAVVVEACAAGDFSKRLSVENKHGVFADICHGLNRIGEVADAGLGEVRTALSMLSNGELNRKMPTDFGGVFGEIAAAVNETSASLSRTVGEISNSAESLNKTSQDIALASSDLSERSEKNAARTAKTAQQLSQMTSEVETAASSARIAGEAVQDVEEMAGEGSKIVAKTVAAMDEIKSSSDEIARVLKVMDEIAFQTNLLALNASVEASRAGDKGRGFAVVATEVRALSQRSADAAKEISNLISSSSAHVDQGVVLAKQSGHSLERIVTGVADASTKLAEIVRAASNTSRSISEISQATTELDADTTENSVAFADTEQAVQNLRSVAHSLATSVASFKIDDSPSSTWKSTDSRFVA